jgi:hypothetical protein
MHRCIRYSDTTQDGDARRAPAACRVHIAFCVLLAVATGASAADRIVIDQGECGAGIHLVARGVPLSDVLARLAATLGFELRLVGPSDSLVDLDIHRPAPELVARLSPPDSIVVQQARDPTCPGQNRIVKVWMLGRGNQSPAYPSAALPPPRQMSDAERKQMQENDDMYRKAHGLPPTSSN